LRFLKTGILLLTEKRQQTGGSDYSID